MPGNWTMVIFSRWTILPPTVVQKRDWTSTSVALRWMCPMAAPAALGAASWAYAGVALSAASRASRARVFIADYFISIRGRPYTDKGREQFFPECQVTAASSTGTGTLIGAHGR